VLAVQYDGRHFNGWQQQHSPKMPSVQDALEKALSTVAAQPIRVQCAGRTDSGVHASHQIAHFDSPVARPETAWTLGVNSQLPDTVAVKWVRAVDADFNARFSATARRYRYIILYSECRPAHMNGEVTWVAPTLDADRMHLAAQALLGKQDFSSFRASHCQSLTATRTVHRVSVIRIGELVVIDIEANAFLHHMVRNIVGSLIEIGVAKRELSWIAELLAAENRALAAATAPAAGLYLVDVHYPDRFGLPEESPGPFFVRQLLD
jgi:tRNA pseudouridine38-40 synthase